MNNQLEMLSRREQLMEDIDCIIESNFGEVEYKDEVIRMLCDAVCHQLPHQLTSCQLTSRSTRKKLPQVWLEDDKFIIESLVIRYVIADDLKLLFKLCRRFKSDAIAQIRHQLT